MASLETVAQPETPGEPGKLVLMDTLEQVATGFQFTEGPAWHPDGYVVFSDIPANQIVRWDAPTKTEVYRDPSHNSNGLAFDLEGRLMACEHGARRVTRTLADGEFAVLAENYEGKRLNSPNDLTLAKDGRIYFTDPPYGVAPADRELDFCGVYRIDTEGKVHLEHKEMPRPNGIALAPDEKTVYVADSQLGIVNAFPVNGDGSLGTPKLFGKMESSGADGLKVDSEGNVYATGPRGVWMWDKDAGWVGLIETPEGPANCGFGEPDGKTLFITAKTSLYRVRTKVAGYFPQGWGTEK